MTDQRSIAMEFPEGTRQAGAYIHSMWLRLTVDATGLIKEACADTEASPYVDVCPAVVPRNQQLVGLRVGPGFRSEIRRLFSGTQGCTHMSELLAAMATGVLQTLFGESPAQPSDRPMQLGGCHAFSASGEVVARYYPQWARKLSSF